MVVRHGLPFSPAAAIKLRFLAATLDHDDDEVRSLTVLFSVLALSVMARAPESMGEETVQSSSEEGVTFKEPKSVAEVGAESKARLVSESGTLSLTVSVSGSGVELFTIGVMGRMFGVGAGVSVRGAGQGSSEGMCSESVGGGGGGVVEGET